MKKTTNVIRWIGVAIFGVMAVGSLGLGGFLGALLFLLGGAIIAPLDIIAKLRGKLKLNKAFSVVLAVVLMFAGVFAMPTSEVPTDNNGSSQITGAVSAETFDTGKITDASKDNTSESTLKMEDTSTKEEATSNQESDSKPTSTTKPEETTTNPIITTKPEETIAKPISTTKPEKTTTKPTTATKPESSKEATSAKPATSTENIPQDNTSQTVYVTETGKRYHCQKDCTGLNNAKAIYSSTLSEAKSRGLTPCTKCY